MDFYNEFEKLKSSKAFNIQDIADLLHKKYDTVRVAIKRKSFSELEMKTITERYFYNDSSEVKDISVSQAFELEFSENKNSNQFLKLENGQYLMTMPLAEFNIQAGILDHYQDIEYMKALAKHSIIVDEPVKGRYLAFRVKGDSMDDGTSNSIVQNSIVSTRELAKHHWINKLRFKDFPYWVIYTTESRYPLLKEIVAHDVERGMIRCHSLNDAPEYTDFDLHLDSVQALFYVVDVNKQLSRKMNY